MENSSVLVGIVFGIGVVLACGLGYITAQTWKLRDKLAEIAEEVSAQGKNAATNITFADGADLPDVGQCLVSIGKTLDMLKIVTNDNARYANQALITHVKASGDYDQLSKDIGVLSANGADMRRSIVILTERFNLLVNKVVEVKNEVDMANQRLTLLAETLLPPMPAILPEPVLRQAQEPAIIKQTMPDVIKDTFTMEVPKDATMEIRVPVSKKRKPGEQLI